MTAWSNNFNGIASGTTVTTANSGGVSGTAFDTVTVPTGGSLAAQTSAAEEGSTGLQIVYSTSNTVGYVGWNATAAVGVRLSTSFWYRFGAVAGSSDAFFSVSSGGQLKIDTAGHILAIAAAATVATSTAVTPGSWVFVQFAATVGTTTTGRLECKITTAAGATLLSYDSGATANLGTTANSTISYGRPGFNTQANTWSYDLLAADNTLTSGFPGPPPPAAVGGDIKVWSGSAWNAKPVKVWNGSAWVVKPLKRWNGSAWVATTY